MLPFRKILFPVDYSEPCRAAVPHVRTMVRYYNAELFLVHAYGVGPVAYSELIANPVLPEQLHPFHEHQLRQFANQMFPGLEVECFVEPGEAGTAIHKFVQHQGADLLMIPAHGHGPLRRLLLGSVTAKVLHDVSTVVWTGTSAALRRDPPGPPYKSIVCALDHTDEAEAVLKAADVFARPFGAQLYLIHAAEVPPSSVELDVTTFQKVILDAANQRLQRLKEKTGVQAPHTVTDATMLDGVRQEAIDRNADLIIVGRGIAQGMLTGLWSRLYPLIRESPCPVLSI